MVLSASLYSQLLQQIPRTTFSQLVNKHDAEKHAKGFTCWTQLVAMLFCHLARADSLRKIYNGLECCLRKLQHLGVNKAPNKSTLSYANAHRPAEMFEELFYSILENFRNAGMIGDGKHRFRFKNKLLTLDSTVISLCLGMFPWAGVRPPRRALRASADDGLSRILRQPCNLENPIWDPWMASRSSLNPAPSVSCVTSLPHA